MIAIATIFESFITTVLVNRSTILYLTTMTAMLRFDSPALEARGYECYKEYKAGPRNGDGVSEPIFCFCFLIQMIGILIALELIL